MLHAYIERHWPLLEDRPVRFLHGDFRPGNLIIDGRRFSGVIDFGSVKVDHVAVDLARLLGSMAGHDDELWRARLRTYAQYRPLSADEQALVAVLDETGTVLGAANWLLWLYRDRKHFEDRRVVARPVIAKTGLFHARAPLPPKRYRDTNTARYIATVGHDRSLNLKLHRQAVTIEAWHEGSEVAGQSLVAQQGVLESLVDDVAKVEVTIGVRRSVMQHERRAPFRHLPQAPIDALLLPLLRPLRLAFREIAAHRERRVGQIQRVFVVSHA